MNTQKHSAINASPFEVVFGQPPTNGIFPDTEKGVQPHEEDLMNLLEDNHILTDSKMTHLLLYCCSIYLTCMLVIEDDNDSPDEGGEVNVEQPRVSTGIIYLSVFGVCMHVSGVCVCVFVCVCVC
jgi:hypothetical protein